MESIDDGGSDDVDGGNCIDGSCDVGIIALVTKIGLRSIFCAFNFIAIDSRHCESTRRMSAVKIL